MIRNDMNDQLWQAIMTRDARFDGQFVFAVSSTKVYCRPSCPSRRPRRERVSFFEEPAARGAAGATPPPRTRFLLRGAGGRGSGGISRVSALQTANGGGRSAVAICAARVRTAR